MRFEDTARAAPHSLSLRLSPPTLVGLAKKPNVARHSGDKSVEVDLIYDADRMTLHVADDGRSFDLTKRPSEGLGLRSMSERLEELGGRADVESVPGEGTRVACVCPLAGASREEGSGA